MIAFNCPKCRQALEFADDAGGRQVRCPGCRAKLRLPGELPPEKEPSAKRPRRKKRRKCQDVEQKTDCSDTPEWLPPMVILAIGLLLSVGGLTLEKGGVGFSAGLVIVGVRLFVTVPLSVAGLFIAAPLLGVNFGSIGLAIVKLSAINVLTLSIAMTATFAGAPAFFGYTIAAPIGWGLFKWFFDLDFNETLFALTVIWVIQFMANLTVTAVQLRAGK